MDIVTIRKDGSRRVQVKCDDVSLTKQSFKDECDINKIVARANAQGVLTHLNDKAPSYGDVSMFPGYQESLNVVLHAEELFNAQTAEVRERFGNDPGRMAEFLADPKNHDEGVRLGLVKPKPEEPAPARVEVVNLPKEGKDAGKS